MKTLKKTLCLVLAVVMVVGVLVLPASAAGTTGTNLETKYEEALKVLNAIEVMQGDENGNLKPNDPITRAEAAAMVARMLESDDVAADWPTDDLTFPDVNPEGWAAPYIAYCVSEGIIEGYPDGTFGPNDSVNGFDLAKMVLVAIGANKADDFNGTGYTSKVYRAANNAGILSNVSISSAGMKRGEVAQLILNALLFTTEEGNVYTVYVKGDDNHDSYDAAIDTLILRTTDWNAAMLLVQNSGYSVDIAPSTEGSLADTVFNGLTRVEGERDGFMRPSILWEDKDGEVVTVAKTPDAYYDGTFTGADGKALIKAAKSEDNITLYYNGSEGGVYFEEDGTTEGQNGLWINDTTGINGYETFVYKTLTGYDVIVREAYVAQVAAAKRTNGDITLTVYEHINASGTAFTVKKTEAADLYSKLAGFADKEYVAAYVKQDWTEKKVESVLEVAGLETVETKITKIEDKVLKTLSTIIVNDGKGAYSVNNEAMAVNAKGEIAGNVMSGTDRNIDRAIDLGDATLYLLNGKVLLVYQEEAKVAPNVLYAYVIDYKVTDLTTGSDQWTPDYDNGTGLKAELKLHIVSGDNAGEEIIYNFVTTATTKKDIEAEIEATWFNKLVEYRPNSAPAAGGTQNTNGNGKATITLIGKSYKATDLGYGKENEGVEGHSKTGDTTVVVTPGAAEGKLANMDVTFDDETVFVVVRGALSAQGKPNAKVEIYHGILDAKLPKLTGDSNTYVQWVEDVATKAESGQAGRVTYVLIRLPYEKAPDAPKPNNVEHFIVGYEGAKIVKEYIDETHTAFIEYYLYEAVVNGKWTQVKVYPDANGDTDSVIWVESVTTDKYDVITKTGTSKIAEKTTIEKLEWAVLNKVLNITTKDEETHRYVVSSNTKVWLYNEETGTIDELAIDDITEDMVGYVDAKDGVLKALYLTINTEAAED